MCRLSNNWHVISTRSDADKRNFEKRAPKGKPPNIKPVSVELADGTIRTFYGTPLLAKFLGVRVDSLYSTLRLKNRALKLHVWKGTADDYEAHMAEYNKKHKPQYRCEWLDGKEKYFMSNQDLSNWTGVAMHTLRKCFVSKSIIDGWKVWKGSEKPDRFYMDKESCGYTYIKDGKGLCFRKWKTLQKHVKIKHSSIDVNG